MCEIILGSHQSFEASWTRFSLLIASCIPERERLPRCVVRVQYTSTHISYTCSLACSLSLLLTLPLPLSFSFEYTLKIFYMNVRVRVQFTVSRINDVSLFCHCIFKIVCVLSFAKYTFHLILHCVSNSRSSAVCFVSYFVLSNYF